MLAISFPDDDDEESDQMAMSMSSGNPLQIAPPMERGSSFTLSQSGTFQQDDFRVNKKGIQSSPAGRDPNKQKISLNELEMLEDLGAGASGTVKKAMHKPSNTLVAVKMINILEKGKRDQMVTELRTMCSNQCPWLVALYDAFYEEGQMYIVLEFMDGGDLSDIVKLSNGKGVDNETALARISRQVLNGLNYLHKQRHQVHRDLKPANVMLTKDGQVKISDFGISTELNDTMGMASTFVGTASYMSPERLSGQAYSFASDIWSFGVILIELILGRYPYPAATNYFQLLNNIIEGASPMVPDETFSPELGEFVGLCLQKEPERRPTAAQLLSHPWMRKYDEDDFNLSGTFEQMKL